MADENKVLDVTSTKTLAGILGVSAIPEPDKDRGGEFADDSEKMFDKAGDTPVKKVEPHIPADKPKKEEGPEIDEEALAKRLGFKIQKKDPPAPAVTKSTDKPVDGASPVAKPEDTAPPKRRRREPEATPSVDAGEIARIATTAATEAMKSVLPRQVQPQPVSAPDPLADLTEKQRSDHAIYSELENSGLPKYRNVAKKYLEGLKIATEYQRKWQRDNPGKSFSAEDDEHDAFFESIEPDVDENDMRRAVARMEVAPMIEEKLKEVREKNAELESRLSEKETVEPMVSQGYGVALRRMTELVDPKFLERIDKDGPAKFAEDEPDVAEALAGQSKWLGAITNEIVRLHHDRKRHPFDFQNPIHAEIYDIANIEEKAIMALPKNEQVDNAGRAFVPRGTYYSMPPNQQSGYWTLADRELVWLSAKRAAARAKNALEEQEKRLESVAKRRGWVKGEATKLGADAQKGEAPLVDTAKNGSAKTQSPEAIQTTQIDTSGKPGASTLSEYERNLAKILFQRKSVSS